MSTKKYKISGLHYMKSKYTSDQIVPKRVKKYVANAVKRSGETYYKDYNTTIIPTAGTLNFQLLNGMQTGDTQGTRSGDKVKLQRLELLIRAYATYNGTDAYGMMLPSAYFKEQMTRLLIVLDKQTNGAIYADTDLLDTVDISAKKNVEYSHRFTIKKSKLLRIRPSVLQVQGNNAETNLGFWRISIPFKNTPVIYNGGNAGTVADIAKNSLYLNMIYSDTNQTAHELSYKFAVQSRLYYKEN